MKLKRLDIILISSVLFVALSLFFIGRLLEDTDGLTAHIHVNGEHTLTIPLHTLSEDPEPPIAIVGFLGHTVYVIVKYNAIKIVEGAHCHHDICSAHDFVSSSIRPIICLPQRIVITLVGGHIDSDVDWMI